MAAAPMLMTVDDYFATPETVMPAEHLRWFAEYGVRECWLVHQGQRNVSVVEFRNGVAQPQRLFASREPIRSAVLPEFSLSLSEILS